MKDMDKICEFFREMPDEEFESRFRGIARTDAFSAVVSSGGDSQDISQVKDDLAAAGINKDWLENDEYFYTVTFHVTTRIFKKLT